MSGTPPGSGSVIDLSTAPQFADAILRLAAGYVPEWRVRDRGAETAVVEIVAHYLQSVARRLEQAPLKNELAFLELLGIRLIPAQPARAPLVVRLADNAADVRMPAGTRVAAPPPPGGSTQISYETETSTGVAVAALRDVLSLWPGRDQYLDHSADVAAGNAFVAFDTRTLQDTPHALYIAHDTLLALSGQAFVSVSFELATASSVALPIRWEYWDGGVWRPFKDMRPACSNQDPIRLDATNGLTSSGAFQLEAECSQTARTSVNGINAYWVRARLDETLPADPARVLPEVEEIRLSTTLTRAYSAIWQVGVKASSGADATNLVVNVLDAKRLPLKGIKLSVLEDTAVHPLPTDPSGTVTLKVTADSANTVAISLFDTFEQREVVTPATGTPLELTFSLGMAPLDLALTDGLPVDVTKPFFPLGAQPQPGSAFYFSYAEAFAKPGAQLHVYIQPASTPQGDLTGDKSQAHQLSWEYWNGRAWVSLQEVSGPGTDPPTAAELLATGVFELTVPSDMAPTTVNNHAALWMRVQLVSGGFGVTRTITVGPARDPTTLSYFVPQPPSLADFRLGYSWQDGPFPPEHVVAYNDFQYADRTDNAVWPGNPFQPFAPVSDNTPALYMGFDRKLPVDDLGIFFDIAEQSGDIEGPTLVWEYSDGIAWQRLTVQDETQNLRVPGIVSFIGPEDMGALPRFGVPRNWLRARLNEDGPPGAPTLERVLPNAVWVTQRQTVIDEPIGTSTGQTSQVFTFRQVPVLPGQEVEVRELAGAPANVEWRILATELFGDSADVLQQLETELAAEGDTTDIQQGPLRLVRDRLKQVTEAWVLWDERPSLFSSSGSDRHYALDRARGRLFFGDGNNGRVPPLGAPIAARVYQTGGGNAGNVAAGAISQLLGPVGGVQSVSNATAAEGGTDAETAAQVAARGPDTIRERGRAITAGDYETMAREASPSVAVARALTARNADGLTAPGWVTLVIIPSSAEPQPYPSFGLRDQVRRYISDRAAADLAAAHQIFVTGPEYQAVDVTGTVVPLDPTQARNIEQAVHDAIATFLHPLNGGPAGVGWPPGSNIFLSDVAAVVERVDGVDYTQELSLLRAGVDAGDFLTLSPTRVPVAGRIRVSLVAG